MTPSGKVARQHMLIFILLSMCGLFGVIAASIADNTPAAWLFWFGMIGSYFGLQSAANEVKRETKA